MYQESNSNRPKTLNYGHWFEGMVASKGRKSVVLNQNNNKQCQYPNFAHTTCECSASVRPMPSICSAQYAP